MNDDLDDPHSEAFRESGVTNDPERERTPQWAKIVGITVIVLILLVPVILLLTSLFGLSWRTSDARDCYSPVPHVAGRCG